MSLLAPFLSLVLVSLLFAAPGDNQTAGEVKALIPAASRNAQPVHVKDSLQWNDLLKTDPAGRLRVGLTDGSILSLGSNSELKVVKSDSASQQTSIEVNYGKLRSKVVHITKPDGKFELRTPNAVIGVIGTDFYVGYANNQTTVICYAGRLTVTPSAGAKVLKGGNVPAGATNTIMLTTGQMVVIGFEIPPGGYQASSAPAPLMEASMLDTNVPDVSAPDIAESGASAMLYAHGTTLLNGSSIPRSSALFSGDRVQTEADSVANINATGSTILIQNKSLVQYEGKAVKLEHGGVTVSTSKSLATHAGSVTVSPAGSVWTEFEVRDFDGKVQIMARKGDLSISDESGTTTLAQGQETTRDEESAKAKNKKKKQAGGGSAPAAAGGVLDSPVAIGIGTGAIVGVAAWVLIRGDEPVSPAK
jgi:ferric-dicitrate binding protein FerR (iron transport regulator)